MAKAELIAGKMLELDGRIRTAAIEHVRQLSEARDYLTSNDLKTGFKFEGERLPLINPQRGIFKPRQMLHLLSIRTVFPKTGARVWYDDQREVHKQIYEGIDAVDYAFMGKDPNSADNRWLRDAMAVRVPVIYFLGIAPGHYKAIIPAYISDWDAKSLSCKVTFGLPSDQGYELPDTALQRRYALRQVKQRLHQASFREVILAAYGERCALSGLPEPLLLDAAHIIVDSDEEYGNPVVQNGIPLSKLHHAAFDAHLIGIDPDYQIHIADRLLDQKDGPILEALKQLHKSKLHLPLRIKDYPDRDRLALRFKDFVSA